MFEATGLPDFTWSDTLVLIWPIYGPPLQTATTGEDIFVPDPSIVVYTHPDCEYSAALKTELSDGSVPFTEIDVSIVPGAIEELLALSGGQGITPVMVEDGKVTVGYHGLG